MAYYRVCPDCGCNLDPDEKCECKAEKEKQKVFYRSVIRTSRTGQMAFVFDSKEADNARKVAY